MFKFLKRQKEMRRNRRKLYKSVERLIDVNVQAYVDKQINENPRYQDPLRLNQHEHQVYSQNGEDGIIEEIFNRIGETNKFFVEFGASTDGLENNSSFLLIKGWSGLWIEPKQKSIERISKKYKEFVDSKKLLLKDAFVTAENIEEILKEKQVPKDLDMLSIDIDGNDYWVWKAIENYSPRLVVIEYNAMMGPEAKWVMKYNPSHVWDGSSYYGSSLKSYELLADKKGYKLVGCDLTGVNAFFVREDCVKNNFCEPLSAKNHYEKPRYYLTRRTGQARVDFGPFESI